jgi:hypothetical protein
MKIEIKDTILEILSRSFKVQMGEQKYLPFFLSHQMPLEYRQVLAELCNRIHIVMGEQIVKFVGGKGVFLPTGV